MALRRRFRTEAEEYAIEFREELKLGPTAPLDPWNLAEHLAVPVTSLSGHPAIANDVKLFFSHRESKFSATTIADGAYREIVINDYKHPNRQRSSLTHELAHIVLGHPPRPPLTDETCRSFDANMEQEANELGFTLLIPKMAALFAVEKFQNLDEASKFYEVSLDLLRYRVRITNARGWAKNRARKFRGA